MAPPAVASHSGGEVSPAAQSPQKVAQAWNSEPWLPDMEDGGGDGTLRPPKRRASVLSPPGGPLDHLRGGSNMLLSSTQLRSPPDLGPQVCSNHCYSLTLLCPSRFQLSAQPLEQAPCYTHSTRERARAENEGDTRQGAQLGGCGLKWKAGVVSFRD